MSDRIMSYHARHGDQRRSREQKVAAAYRDDPFNARLSAMEPGDRETLLAKLGPSARISFGHFVQTRSAAQKTGKDVSA